MSATKFNARTIAFLICTSLCAACVPNNHSTAIPASAPISKQRVSFADKTRVRVHSDIKLSSNGLADFNEFRKTGGAYGAMYVTGNGEAFSWRSRRFSVEDAKAAAQVDCEAFFQQGCVLYATMVAASASEGLVFIPDQNRDIWEDVLRETLAGNYIAIATNKTGASGFAWDHSTASKARARALRTCKGNTAAKYEEKIARVVSANEAAGIYECRILGTFR